MPSTSPATSTGRTFTADDKPYVPPTGTSLGSFDDGTWDGWTTTGTAFGSAPTPGNAPGQGGVSNYIGAGLANSFNGLDGPTGTLTSPDFTIDQAYLNFLVGGGNHPYVPGSAVGGTVPAGTTFADFEGPTYGAGWTTTGDFTGTTPAAGALPGQQQVTGYVGNQLVNTFENGDASQGTITSPSFTIASDYINLLVGGGNHPWGSPNPTSVEPHRRRQRGRQQHRAERGGPELERLGRARLRGQDRDHPDRGPERRRMGSPERRPDHLLAPARSARRRRHLGEAGRRRAGRPVGDRARTARPSTGTAGTSATCRGRPATSRSSTTTPADGGTSSPTSSASPASQRSPRCNVRTGSTSARTTTPPSPTTTPRVASAS